MLPIDVPRCHQIHLNGVRCGSPALRGQSHCYYHSVLRQKRDVPTIPYLEDALSVQFSLREIMQGVALGKWDTKRAALLLYALQIASSNLKRIESEFRLAKYDAITEVPLESYVNADELKASKKNTGTKKKSAHRSAKRAKNSAPKKPAAPSTVAAEASGSPARAAVARDGVKSFPGMFMPGEPSSHANGSA